MDLMGDIHGTFRNIRDWIEYSTDNVLIQVGDFGLGFGREERDLENLDEMNSLARDEAKHIYIIRGNHDDPRFWAEERFQDRWSNLMLVQDYTVLDIEGMKVLFVGGAISIDRTGRRLGVDHWEGVEFDYDEEKLMEVLRNYGPVDVVVTHTAPHFCRPRGFNRLVYDFAENDKNLLDELKVERALMSRMYEVIRSFDLPKYWVYGHFHNDEREEVDGTTFILLGIGSVTNIKS